MIAGRFGENGELFFEAELMASNGEGFGIEVLLDTGFTTGWLAINSQDLEALGWYELSLQVEMQTVRGIKLFNLYEGLITFGGIEFIIPVHVTDELPENLLGAQWLQTMQLIVNKPQGILTLEIVDDQ